MVAARLVFFSWHSQTMITDQSSASDLDEAFLAGALGAGIIHHAEKQWEKEKQAWKESMNDMLYWQEKYRK